MSASGKSFWGEPGGIIAIVVAVIGAIGAIVAALVGGDVINVTAGGAITAGPTPASSSPPPTTAPPSNELEPTPTPEPTDASEVRRTTVGKTPLTLTHAYYADLDSMTPSWDVEYAGTERRFDLGLGDVGLRAGSTSDLAVVSGPSSYDTCVNATGYQKGLARDDVSTGTNFCMRTSEKHYALVAIKKDTGKGRDWKLVLDVTVWNPPFEE